MFKVKDKISNKIYDVYAVDCAVKINPNSSPLFLIYENNEWKWIRAELFEPYNVETITTNNFRNAYTSLDNIANKIEDDRRKRKDGLDA